MTPYRVSARVDTSAADRDEALAFSRSVRGPVAFRAALVLIVTIGVPAALYWHQWLSVGRSFCCF